MDNGIVSSVNNRPKMSLLVEEGSLYPALQRLELKAG